MKLPKELTEISFGPGYPFGVEHEDYLSEMKSSKGYKSIVGKYNIHGGVLAYVAAEERNGEPTSEVYSIPLSEIFREDLSPELREEIHRLYGKNGEKIYGMLEEAGFERDKDLYVPHSNDLGVWSSKIAKDAHILERIERRMKIANMYERLGMKPKVELPDDIAKEYLRPAWEGFENGEYWLLNSGFYDTNNGVLVVVDEYGIPYVGVRGKELEEKIEEAGFRRGRVFVPHSNDEGVWLKYMRLK